MTATVSANPVPSPVARRSRLFVTVGRAALFMGALAFVPPALSLAHVAEAQADQLAIEQARPASFADLAATHFVELAIYLSSFRNEETGYPSRPYPQFASRFAEYDHLARVKEWAAGDNGDEA